jgi:hypothetical protein
MLLQEAVASLICQAAEHACNSLRKPKMLRFRWMGFRGQHATS